MRHAVSCGPLLSRMDHYEPLILQSKFGRHLTQPTPVTRATKATLTNCAWSGRSWWWPPGVGAEWHFVVNWRRSAIALPAQR